MAVSVPIPPFADVAVEELRTPPYSMEAEEAVIGGLLIDNQAWDQVFDLLGENDFFKKEHRLFFSVIQKLSADNQPFDAVTVADRLKDAGKASEDVLAYLLLLAKDTPSAANIKAYANIVREKAVRRKLIKVANAIIENTTQADEDLHGDVLLDKAEQMVFEIAEDDLRNRQEFEPLGSASVAAYDQIDALYNKGGDITGLPTGYAEFDKLTSGLQKGDLIIIAGRPSMGKTSLAANVVEYVGIQRKENGPIAMFNMEMPARHIAMRFYASLARIDLMRLRQGNLLDEEWPRMTSAMKIMQGVPIYIDDSNTLTPFQIRARARRLKREHKGLSLIVVDYLQLMRLEEKMENRVVEISEISRSLKSLARELDVPVIALSQLNRSLEQRQDKRPIMSDLRESGAIEQDADLIVFIYRDEVYDEETKEQGVAEIRVAKQRNGPQFMTKLTFLKQFTRFENYFPEGSYPSMADAPAQSPDEII